MWSPLLTLAFAGFGLLLAGAPAAQGAPTSAVSPVIAGAQSTRPAWPELVVGEIDTARFRILYTQRAEGAGRKLARDLELTRDYFSRVLGRDWPGTTEIRVGSGRKEFEQLALPGDKPPDWSRAYSYPVENIIVLEAGSQTESDANATLRHELLHVALGQLGGDWPHWFHDGLAMYLTGQRYSLSQYASLFRAVQQDRIFSFRDLTDRWPQQASDVEIAYAQSVAFVGFLVERHGKAAIAELIDGVVEGQPFETAFAKAFKASVWFEETAWRRQLPSRYSWLPILTNSSTLWALVAFICVAAFLRLRTRGRRRRAEMEADELAERESILSAEPDPPAKAFFGSGATTASNDNVELGDDGGSHSSKSSS